MLGSRVPQFVRGRTKVADPELVVQPDPDVETPDPTDPADAADAAPAPDAVDPAVPETEDPDPE